MAQAATATPAEEPAATKENGMCGGKCVIRRSVVNSQSDICLAPPSNAAKAANAPAPANNFPPPKTDKPRPHVCQTCGRSFARLEHLKRHERSHTKEKPFECPQCTRCFARRDLLLRHQQKLHQAGAASSRPRNGRRESVAGTGQTNGNSRARKNSISGNMNGANGTSNMRPRANTISHIDGTSLNLLMSQGMARANGMPQFSPHSGLNGFSHGGLDFHRMAGYSQHAHIQGLPKLETHGLNINLGGGLRTAPIPGMNGESFDPDKIFSGSTVNPAQLHFGPAMGASFSPFQNFPPFASALEDDDSFDWTRGLSETLIHGNGEAVVAGSSPSAISTASQSGFSDVMVDGSNTLPRTSGNLWSSSMIAPALVGSSGFSTDPISQAVFPEFVSQANTISPKELHEQQMTDSLLFSTPPPLSSLSPTTAIPGMPNQYFQQPMAFNSDTTSVSSASVNGSARQSSVTSVSTDSITDATRQALIFSLSQPSGYGATSRKYSQPPISSPLSPGFGPRVGMPQVSLPSTADLQRYVSAYIHYFHPHMPFLHIPTLSFDSPVFTSNMRAHHSFSEGIVGGGGCLILAMAAIGASYEFDHAAGKDLFEAAKKMISIYLEERRTAGVTIASNASLNGAPTPPQKTPLWLVQAMLLNLIYGHQCGDKIAADIATTHCAALVSLAKAAELDKPDPDVELDISRSYAMRPMSVDGDVDMGEDGMSPRLRQRNGTQETKEEFAEWYRWKSKEERKRTLFSVFVLSSLLVTAYNHQPRILNSELHLNLPCEEDIWAADSPRTWISLGGYGLADQNSITFADALTFLLTASQRQRPDTRLSSSYHPTFGSSVPLDELPESDLKPSTFGCYVLINALHVYIWETRQRHQGRQWKTQETEQMHAQVEPALRAWQAAWRSNSHHTLDRPNPYGPLPADSIPLLDLAYVRLFVNLGRSKESFWARDFEAMSDELGRGHEIIQHAENSRDCSSEPSASSTSNNTSANSPGAPGSPKDALADAASDIPNVVPNSNVQQPGQSSKRERHLRKAAFYAADSLSMADKLGVTFAEFTSRELPIQAAMCTFDCAQVLAEWVATVQERVGRFLGIIGRDEIDFTQVPAIMLLEDEDCKLLEKLNEILNHADVKITFDAASMGTSPEAVLGPYSALKDCGHGSRLLLVTAYMLEKAAVWGSKCKLLRGTSHILTTSSHQSDVTSHASPRRSPQATS